MLRTLALPLVALLLTGLAHAADKPQRIVSTTPSVTGILLAINAPVIATAAAAPSRLTDAKGFSGSGPKSPTSAQCKCCIPTCSLILRP